MTSACNLKDTLGNDTQAFLKFDISIFEICSHLINSNFTSYFLTSSTLSWNAGTSKEIPPDERLIIFTRIPITFWSQSPIIICIPSIIKPKMFPPISPESNDSDLFYVEQSSNECSPPRQNTPIVLSIEISGNNTREMITISSTASPGPQIVTIDSDSNEPTMSYGIGRQLAIIPPNLNNLNLPPDRFNILATMVVANPKAEGHDENYSPQSPEPSEPSPISTPPMNLSTIEGRETPHTTTDDNTFYSDDEPRTSFLPSSPSPPPPPQKLKRAGRDSSYCCWPNIRTRHKVIF